MKRNAARIAKEIVPYLKGDPVPVETLQRWLIALAPAPRRVRTKDPRREERRVSIKALDAMCREIVFHRDNHTCRRCGNQATDWCHVHTRGCHNVRWDLDNSWAGCRGCHMNFWHKQPLEAAEWWRQQIGEVRYQSLRLRSNQGRRAPNYAAVKAYLDSERRLLERYQEKATPQSEIESS